MLEAVRRAWRWLRESDAFGLVVVAWAGFGIWGAVHPDFGPTAVWVAWFLPFVIWICIEVARYLPAQDFASQPWSARLRELYTIFRWRSWSGREWGFWLIAVVFGIPFALHGLVFGPPAADRVGSLVLLVVCATIGWIGIKVVDARITRKQRRVLEGSHFDDDEDNRWRWDSRGEIVTFLVIAILVLSVVAVVEWRDDDGPDMPEAVIWFVGLGLLLIVPLVRSLRRWDREHPR